MEFREFGKTAKRLSRFGLGAMRLPHSGGRMDFDAAGELIRHALARDINFIDTAYVYTNSEEAIGRAVAGIDRSSFYVQTKAPLRLTDGRGAIRRYLETSLERLRMDHVDFFLAHDVRGRAAGRPLKRFLKEAQKARTEGLVHHIGFSSHDTPAAILRLIDMDEFECMLVQYNLLDMNNTVPIAHGRLRGLGVSVMGPLGGGKLAQPTELTRQLEPRAESGVRPGLRFVLSNPNVNVAFSGVGTIGQLDENLEIASNGAPLTDNEAAEIERAIFEKRDLLDLYCTDCRYCMPCPNGVNIPEIFQLAQHARLYDVRDHANDAYRGQLRANQAVDRCLRCGDCEPKCPQKLQIRDLLAENHRLLTGEDL